MSFGNFLLGVAEGLDRGVEAGDRISAARDRKKVRDAGKQAGKDGQLMRQAEAAGNERIKGAPPVAPAPATAPAAAPMMANAAPRPSLQPNYTPAARMGVSMPQAAPAIFPGAVASTYGVMGARTPQRFAGEEYPAEQLY